MSSNNIPLDLLPIGTISRAKGLNGELKVFLYNEESDTLNENSDIWIKDNDSFRSFKLKSISLTGNNRIIKLENIDSRNASEELASKKIYISRSKFPDSKEHYLIDIITFKVFDTCNNSLGRVLDVINLPTNNSILIECNNKEIMIPIIDDFIELFDFKNKKIIIKNSDVFINKC